MPSIGAPELIVVLVIALLVLGPKRLPEAGRSLGSGIRGFRDSLSGGGNTAPDAVEVAEKAEASQRGLSAPVEYSPPSAG